MRVVVAPDKFKGSLGAADVAAALAAGVRDVLPEAQCVLVPMADGGDGTVEAFLAGGAQARRLTVSGPLGAPVEAEYARAGELAAIEMAAASGLALPGPRNARRATTRGTGELLRDALDGGATRIVLGIGGSATTDGGAGALAALGARFLDASGTELDPTPEALARLERVDLSGFETRLLAVGADAAGSSDGPASSSACAVDLAVACDVDNPLLGPHGAAAVYGPQKGASADDVAFLDGVLARLADALAAAGARELRDVPGAGAAGGLGWALASVCGARLERGVVLVAAARGLAEALRGADLCLTGEGRIDVQTLHGKVVAGVADVARAAGVPVIAFGGSVDPAAEAALRARGVVCVPTVPGPLGLDTAMHPATAAANLRAAAARVAALRLLR
ncbi:MAG: glycerate 2-kinase [Candidatus Eremiobacteraeota bacterium]|nr:glycerate 2-kinase [Candidatus Eremiobacteraeota bacterium]